ncbi:phage head closure protein [Schleiferilactobacillus harbinensis]|uniref:Phage head closure protein n=1 Tax=Schleiferilactobacillus harbinensis TaxID=304207 RepID=A0ABU7T370_9LACO
MVQLANPARLDTVIEFGGLGDPVPNQNGVPKQPFEPAFAMWAGAWQLTTTQLLQVSGMAQTNTLIYVVHHREDWDGITDARIGDQSYHIGTIAKDATNLPTSYDLVTLEAVSKNG